MAENNYNSNRNSRNDYWEQNRNRYNQDDAFSRNRENNESFGNAGYSQRRNEDYDRYDDRQGNDYGQRQRVRYMPDNDDNRYYGGHGYQQASGDDYGHDFNPGGYNRYDDRGSFGNAQRNQYNDRQGSYSSSRGGRQHVQDQYNRDFRSNMRGEVDHEQDWNRSRYERDRNYGGRDNRNWWDRTKDEVASWFGDDDAERRRDGDRRYEGGNYRSDYDRNDERSHNYGSNRGKGPKGYARSKERIWEDVCDRLSYDDRLDASEIEVNVENNDVILSGTVTTREEKRRAEMIAEQIPGVKNVENRIKLAAPDVGTTETTTTILRKTGALDEQQDKNQW